MESKIKIKPVLFFKRTNPPVFIISAIIMLGFILAATLFTSSSKTFFDWVQFAIVKNLSWVFTLSTILFLVFVLFLLFSRFGRIRLSSTDEKPEFSYATWFAMMFSAGMGIGLVFWSIAEPIKHYIAPPIVESATLTSAKQAIGITFFHWGLHAWAIYMVVGLSLAYFSFRKGLPLTIRSCFYPLLGNKIYGGDDKQHSLIQRVREKPEDQGAHDRAVVGRSYFKNSRRNLGQFVIRFNPRIKNQALVLRIVCSALIAFI